MDLYDVGSYETQTLLKLPPLQPTAELRRQQCASAAERRAPIAVRDRARDLERFFGPSVFLELQGPDDMSRGHVTAK